MCGVWTGYFVFGLTVALRWPLVGNAGLIARISARFVTGLVVLPGWQIFSVTHRKQTLSMRRQRASRISARELRPMTWRTPLVEQCV